MLGKVEAEQIRELCKRLCAVNSATNTAPPGYFRIDAGDGAKRARKVAASVDWLDPATTADEVIRRVNGVINEYKWVFVRAMPQGESHPSESIRIEGSPEPQIGGERDDDAPRGKDAAAEALGMVALGQMRTIEALTDRLERLHTDVQESTLKAGLYQYHSEALQLGSKSELLSRTVEQIGPTLVAQIPNILAAVAAIQSGQPVPAAPPAAETAPAEPADAICWHVDRILASAVGLQTSFSAATPEQRQAAAPVLGRLRALVESIAPLVGLRVQQEQQHEQGE